MTLNAFNYAIQNATGDRHSADKEILMTFE